MKKATIIFTLLLLASMPGLDTQAQNEPKNQLIMVWQNQITPENAVQYEKVVKLQLGVLNKYAYPVPFYIYATDDYYYYWVTPINNLSDIEAQNKMWGEFQQQVMQQEGSFPFHQFKGIVHQLTPQVFLMRADLSYFPPEMTNDMEKPYFRFGYCYVKLGYEAEFEEGWKKCMEPFSAHQVSIGVTLYEGVLGTENPFYLWGEVYRDEIDMATSRAKAFEEMDRALDTLWPETVKYLRKIEYKTGWFRPDLSYMPAN